MARTPRILIVKPETGVADVAVYVESGGTIVPNTAREVPLADFMAQGRAENCTCRLIECSCALVAGHKNDCRFRIAVLCAVGIECEHGYDVCPQCDACTCG